MSPLLLTVFQLGIGCVHAFCAFKMDAPIFRDRASKNWISSLRSCPFEAEPPNLPERHPRRNPSAKSVRRACGREALPEYSTLHSPHSPFQHFLAMEPKEQQPANQGDASLLPKVTVTLIHQNSKQIP